MSAAAVARVKCFFGVHRYGSLTTTYRGPDGRAYIPCMECFKPRRLSDAWAPPRPVAVELPVTAPVAHAVVDLGERRAGRR